jgi:myo-inositol-1(or 4)-monophosphatase
VLAFTRTLVEESAARLAADFGSIDEHGIDLKGRRDLVTATDREVEAFIAERIAAQFPDDAILGEEAVRRPGPSGRVWIVDPLDGTVNFVHQHPIFCVSIALAEGYVGPPRPDGAFDLRASGFFDPAHLPRVVLGAVAAPLLRETFWAERGGGAWLNGRRLRSATTPELEDALVATGFAYRRNELANNNLGNFGRLALSARGVRRGGSAALDLCYVAAGRFGAFWELYLKPWDVAAGIVLVEEAGGRVTDFAGGHRAIEGVEVLASNGRLHEAVRGKLEGADPEWARGERLKLGLVS